MVPHQARSQSPEAILYQTSLGKVTRRELHRPAGGKLGGPRRPRMGKFGYGWAIPNFDRGAGALRQLACSGGHTLQLKDLVWLLG